MKHRDLVFCERFSHKASSPTCNREVRRTAEGLYEVCSLHVERDRDEYESFLYGDLGCCINCRGFVTCRYVQWGSYE